MQNGTRETRAVDYSDIDQLGPNYARILEIAFLVGLSIVFFLSVLIDIEIHTKIWWVLLVIFALFYSSFRIILGVGAAESYYVLLFPILSGTIWKVGLSFDIDLSQFLIIASAVMFFCFPVIHASAGLIFLFVFVFVSTVKHMHPVANIIWLPAFGIVWGLMFWHLRREREWFKTKYVNFESKAKGFLSSVSIPTENEPISSIDSESKVARAAASVMRIETITEQMIEILHDIIHPNSTYFYFLDSEAGIYKILAFRSRSRFFDKDATVEFDSKGLLAWVIQNKRHLRHERLPRSMQHPDYYSARERVLSCMIFPIMNETTVEGLIGVDSHRSHAFGAEEEHLVRLFSTLLSDVVEAFRLHQKKDVRTDYLLTFYSAFKRLLEVKLDTNKRMELLIEISEMLKRSDEAAVFVVDENSQFVMRKAIGAFFPKLIGARIHPDSLIGKKLSAGNEVILIDPIESQEKLFIFTPAEPSIKINSAMVVPLVLEKKHLGALVLGSRRRDYYTETERYLLDSLAAQFSFSLENAINAQRIQELAVTDGLTGTFNHRHFQDTLTREIKRSKRDPSTLSLLMIDIDHFKKFNDAYGHQAGDEVLKGIARLLREQAREIDLVARYGGEEFAVLLVKCDIKSAQQMAERIRKTCAKATWKIGEEILSVTMSIGVANYPSQSQTGADLIACADKALYKAKSSGRNQVFVFQANSPDDA